MSLPPGLLPIARQLQSVLLLEIEHEIEIERMVSDERYARDVLLVCDACPQTVLPQLATQYRAVWAPAAAAAAAAAAQEAPAMAMPDSMARRAIEAAWAPDSRPLPAAAAHPPPPSAAALQPAQPRPPASAWLQRWWTRLGRR